MLDRLARPSRVVWEALVDLVFPPTCVLCQRVGRDICEHCWQTAFTPADLSQKPPLPHIDDFIALAAHRGVVREALHGLKYEGQTRLALPLAARLAEKISWPVDALIPVPLHFSRMAERGYNQAKLLAEALAMRIHTPVMDHVLIRTKATASQVTLNAQERRQNVVEAFSASGPAPQRVLLVDDVCTTGATLSAAAATLRQAGASVIYAATISLAQ
jgi:ComF family protein